MSDPNAERILRKYKGFENSVKQMLTQEYKFLGGEKIQEMFIKDLLVEFNRHLKDGWKLDAGQVVWWAVHKDEYPGRNKTIESMRMVPVILSIASKDDLLLRLDGYSAKEIRKCKLARILREAVESGRCKSLDWGECRNYWQGYQRIPVAAFSYPAISRDGSRYRTDIDPQEDNHPAICSEYPDSGDCQKNVT